MTVRSLTIGSYPRDSHIGRSSNLAYSLTNYQIIFLPHNSCPVNHLTIKDFLHVSSQVSDFEVNAQPKIGMNRKNGATKTQPQLVMTNRETLIGQADLVRKVANEETQETSLISDEMSPTFIVWISGCRSSTGTKDQIICSQRLCLFSI